MNTNDKSQNAVMSLLPRGFEDLLPPAAEHEFRAIGTLMKTFAGYGYARVKPPLAEFEESLLAPGPGAATAEQTFRVADPLSDKMLALRSDITAQIARIAGTRLAEEARPLRLTYANDVLRTKASQQRTLRQFCQVGCEMIGTADTDSVIEIAVLALKGLGVLKVSDVTFDFSLPRIVDDVFQAAGKAPDEIDALRAELAGPAENAIPKLEALGLDVTDLKAVIAGLAEFKDVSFTVDPLETRGFEYHNGVTFTIFAKGVNGELGRGGAYDLVCAQGKIREGGAGFTLYMDTVCTAMPEAQEKPRVLVPRSEPWNVCEDLQAQGYITIRGDDKSRGPCTHVYKDGKVQSL